MEFSARENPAVPYPRASQGRPSNPPRTDPESLASSWFYTRNCRNTQACTTIPLLPSHEHFPYGKKRCGQEPRQRTVDQAIRGRERKMVGGSGEICGAINDEGACAGVWRLVPPGRDGACDGEWEFVPPRKRRS